MGAYTSDLVFQETMAKGVSGIGIYAKDALEGLYTGGDLSVTQIQSITTGAPTAQWSFTTSLSTPGLLP